MDHKKPCICIHTVEKVLLSWHYTPEFVVDNSVSVLYVLYLPAFPSSISSHCTIKRFSCKHENNNNNDSNDNNDRYSVFFLEKNKKNQVL